MKKIIFPIITIFLTLSLPACAPVVPFAHVPDGNVAVLIGQDHQTVHDYMEATGHIPAGFMLYTSIQEMDGLDGWSKDFGAGRQNAAELLSEYPGKALQVGLYMVDALQKTYQGRFDANIGKMARWLNAVKVPVFLRIGYEFDGPHNGYGPQDYRKAYIYIVDKLREAGVKNALYVWHSYASVGAEDLDAYYPGDGYVDWVGISYFDQPEGFMLPVVHFAREKGKPVMIAEATPKGKKTSHGRLAWEIWYRPFFRFVEMNGIKIISYINCHWDVMPMFAGQGWGDARLQADDYVKKAWLEKIGEQRYDFTF